MDNFFSEVFRIFYTLKNYRTSQLGWYLYYRVRKLFPVSLWFSLKCPSNIQPDNDKIERLKRFALFWGKVAKPTKEEIEKILKGEIEYAGEICDLEILLSDKNSNVSPLALYGLHSFEFLWKLCLFYLDSTDARIEEFAKDCVKRWIEHYPPGREVAWDPYPTSFRIRYFLTALSIWKWEDKFILDSIWLQIQYLYRSLEFHLLGNHLIQNIVGCLVGAEIFSIGFREKLLKLLQKELEEQILEDGGHYERVPMYHFHVILDLLWLVAILDPVPKFLEEKFRNMCKFAEDITMSDGNYPLFGDSVYHHLPTWKEISSVAEQLLGDSIKNKEFKPELVDLKSSGYYIFRHSASSGKKVELVVRGGSAGVDYQLAHAHSDQLSYEILVDGNRFIVDSGMHGYAGSPYRKFQRSCRAHNIVWIEGVEQLEAWGVFRVARRGRCEIEEVKRENDVFKFVGSYYFYSGERHKRTMEFRFPTLFVRDEVAFLRQSRKVYNFIHFHPNVNVQLDNGSIIAFGYGIRVNLFFTGADNLIVHKGLSDFSQGWYSERFGSSVPNCVVVLEKQCDLDTTSFAFEYKLVFDQSEHYKGLIYGQEKKESK